MIKTTILIQIFLLIYSINSIGQIKYFVESSANMTILPTSERRHEDKFSTKYDILVKIDNREKPGFDILVGLNKTLTKRISLETGLGFTYIRYSTFLYTANIPKNKESSSYVIIYNMPYPENYIQFKVFDNTNILYFDLPIILKLSQLNKLFVGAGLSVSFVSDSKRTMEDITDYSSDGLKNTIFNFILTSEYQISERFTSTAKFKKVITPIFDVKGSKIRPNILNIGLKYHFKL